MYLAYIFCLRQNVGPETRYLRRLNPTIFFQFSKNLYPIIILCLLEELKSARNNFQIHRPPGFR
ncbi:MAG: hypothetical protein LBF22_07655, partial [Deltaproteobacteria bacterium]|nr:hypothetical protein [Deltaproteobacteria bacterium]